MANIDSEYDSFIHLTIKFNSKNYSISIFPGIFNSKDYSITFSPENSIQKQIQKLNLAVFNLTKYSFNQKTQVSPTPTKKYLICVNATAVARVSNEAGKTFQRQLAFTSLFFKLLTPFKLGNNFVLLQSLLYLSLVYIIEFRVAC